MSTADQRTTYGSILRYAAYVVGAYGVENTIRSSVHCTVLYYGTTVLVLSRESMYGRQPGSREITR